LDCYVDAFFNEYGFSDTDVDFHSH
jgi:hypothetical protein